MSNRRNTMITVCAGLVSGAVGTMLAGVLAAPARSVVTNKAAEAVTADLSQTAKWLDERSDARLKALERKAAEYQMSAAVPKEEKTDQALPPAVSPEEAREMVLEQWDERLADHDAEPVNHSWAQAVSKNIEADVSTMASAGSFKLVGVQCKTKTCSAKVEWPSYEQAVSKYTDLLHHRYKEDCRRELLLPEPAEPAAPYQATVIYDCGHGG